MTHALAWNRYGKSRIRLVKVRRPPATASDGADAAAPHHLVDLTLDVQLEGAFDAVYVEGDNRACLATDTMKNTVYAIARQDPIDHVEAFALRLAGHFAAQAAVSRVTIRAVEQPWDRLSAHGRAHPHAFVQRGAEQWTAVVEQDARHVAPESDRDAAPATVTAGVTNLVVLKTGGSSFAGFPRDRYTTLAETDDRLLATSMTASWVYRAGTVDFAARDLIRAALVETFAAHDSRSMQHTLYAMADAALAACASVAEITLTLPNRHHLLVDLAPFGLDNPNEIFVATDQPFGLIEATVRRTAG
jgi:urate oxidase